MVFAKTEGEDRKYLMAEIKGDREAAVRRKRLKRRAEEREKLKEEKRGGREEEKIERNREHIEARL